jgi:7,8-dihydropterin-6-yl-methyl-4-(beta-D-ribofuranosyl)aminobenzene 5'-phosphate synthase
MPTSAIVTVLVENTVSRPALLAEHGLAFWIDMGTRRILFDTGQSSLVAENATKLGIDLAAVDTVALSHGHYDHTGGLATVLSQAVEPVVVHAHPAALGPKYHRKNTGIREIGITALSLDALSRHNAILRNFHGPIEIAPSLYLTGEIPRLHPEEANNPNFSLDPEGIRPDPFEDDQAIYMNTSAGTLVLLGCAHAGVINTLDAIRRLTGSRPFYAVLGGMHLNSASPERLAWTIDALRRFSIEKLYPAHCTGMEATAALWAAFPDRCFPCNVGTSLSVQVT